MSIIKLLISSMYYLIYMTLEKWMNPIFVLGVASAGMYGWHICKKNVSIKFAWKKLLLLLVFILYVGITVCAYINGVDKGILSNSLRVIYYAGMLGAGVGIGNDLGMAIRQKKFRVRTLDIKAWKKMRNIGISIYAVSLVPLALISPYIFPKADDFSFGYHAHRAWEATGSLLEVVKAAYTMIVEAYFDWQGTYSSIFLMAIQPAVFDERLYAIVPFIFIGIITLSSYFFWKTVFVDWLHADKVMSQVFIWIYVIFIIQRVPDSQSAFIWYNGATHYITSHGAMLCLLAFMIRLCLGKRQWSNWMGAAFMAFYVAGGNYVTAVSMLLICLTILFAVAVIKAWKRYKAVVGICIVYILSLLLNVLAPGNFIRKDRYEGYGIIRAFVLAFVKALEYMFGTWMHWSIVLLILILMPVLWYLVQKTEFQFQYPALVVVYSWCYMASLFFTPLYTLGIVDVGRFQNVMFIHWMTVLLFDIAYVMGWIQRMYDSKDAYGLVVSSEQKYVGCVLGVFMVFMALSMLAEPERYTSLYAMETLLDPQLEQYGEEYWNMVEILNSEEKNVEIQDFSYIPKYFDVSLRNEGLKLFYGKDSIVVKEP